MPVDQHLLIALVAPRPVLICSAEEDLWADPEGEFLAAAHAGPAFALLGCETISHATLPPVQELVGGRVSYHLRPGKHDMTLEDWKVYLDFADREL